MVTRLLRAMGPHGPGLAPTGISRENSSARGFGWCPSSKQRRLSGLNFPKTRRDTRSRRVFPRRSRDEQIILALPGPHTPGARPITAASVLSAARLTLGRRGDPVPEPPVTPLRAAGERGTEGPDPLGPQPEPQRLPLLCSPSGPEAEAWLERAGEDVQMKDLARVTMWSTPHATSTGSPGIVT